MKETQAIICDENQNVTLEKVVLPDLQAKDILIKNLYSGISIGTEMLLVRNKISWGDFPICLGYQAVGVVEKIGTNVTDFKVGDKVYHRGHQREILLDGKAVSATSGSHMSYSIIDTSAPQEGAVDAAHSAAILPEELIDEEAASLFVMPAVGLNGVNMSGVKMGDTVAVLGIGLIGLGVMVAAKLRGAAAIAIDLDDARLEMAKKLGADYTINPNNGDMLEQLEKICPGGADVVFEASGVPACLNIALGLCRDHGKFVFQGNYGQDSQPLNFLAAHVKHLTAYFPCDDGLQPCRHAVLELMASGALKWGQTITHRLTPQEAPGFYSDLNQGKIKDTLGAVIQWT